MAEVKWIKLYVDMFNNRKIKFIRKLPDGNDILLCWVMMLSSAGKCNAGGYIFLTENIPYTPEMLSNEYEIPLSTIKLALETFRKLNMINIDQDNCISLSGWEEYQSTDKMAEIREYNRLAKQKQRKNTKMLSDGVNDLSMTGQGMSTSCQYTDIDQELDIEKEKTIILTSDEDAFFKALQLVKNYPFDREKDLEMYEKLKERYPQLDLVESIKDWSTYKIDKPLKDKCNPRSQINTSCKKHVEWGRNLRTENKPTPKPNEIPTKTVIR